MTKSGLRRTLMAHSTLEEAPEMTGSTAPVNSTPNSIPMAAQAVTTSTLDGGKIVTKTSREKKSIISTSGATTSTAQMT